jgi:hypothetical protein
MQAVEDLNRDAWIKAHVRQFRPCGFVVRFDRRLVLGQRQPKADERVHMTVGDVVDDLASRPAAVAIGLIEPGAGHRRLELARETGDGGDKVPPLVAGQVGIKREFSGRKAWVHGPAMIA